LVALAPATVKPFAGTPPKDHPGLAASVIVAVYATFPAKSPSFGDQVTVPEYCAASMESTTGIAPATGAITPVMAN
jgi:hypothetical protein